MREVRVWGRGVDSASFSPERRDVALRRELLGDGELLLLSVGRVSREKRLEVLLDAFEQLHRWDPGLRLVIVGDGPARAGLEAVAPEGVRFVGEERGERLAALYASADLFCFPSTTDTFGQVILEAQASGLPVVAAEAGGAPSLVQDGVTGFLTRPDDAVAMAAALALLVADDELRAGCTRRAVAAARERTWELSYEELLGA
jgi:glycosyltransferase involved in cell wall biosynthesis